MADDEQGGSEWSVEQRLGDELRALLAKVDPVPDPVVGAARGSYAWRTIDAELAELAFDSLLEAGATVRSTEAARLLSFESPDMSLEVELARAGEDVTLLGQVVPAQAGTVEVQGGEGLETASVDATGAFSVRVAAGQRYRLRFQPGGGAGAVQSEWFTT